MKKSVIILIAVIYVAAIAIVSFFGMDFEMFEQVIYVEEVKLKNEGLDFSNKSTPEWKKWNTKIYPLDSYVDDGQIVFEFAYQLEVEVLPKDATDKTVKYTVSSVKDGVTVDITPDGLVTITSKSNTSVTILITPNDGSNTMTSITFLCFAQLSS